MSLFDDIKNREETSGFSSYEFSTESSHTFFSFEDDHSDDVSSDDETSGSDSSDGFQMYSEDNDVSSDGETETELLDEGKEEVDAAQEEVDEAQEKVDEMSDEAEKSQEALVATEALYANVLAAKMLGGLSAPHCELVSEHIRYIGEVIGMPPRMRPSFDVSLEAFSTPASVELSTEGVLESIGNMFKKIWNTIKWVFKQIWEGIKFVVGKIVAWTKSFFDWVYRKIAGLFTKIKGLGKGEFSEDQIRERLGQGFLAKPFNGIKDLLVSNEQVFKLFGDFNQANLKTIRTLGKGLNEYADGIGEIFEGKESGISKVSKVNLDSLPAVIANIESFIKQAKGRKGVALAKEGDNFIIFTGAGVIEFSFNEKSKLFKKLEKASEGSSDTAHDVEDDSEYTKKIVKKINDVVTSCTEKFPLANKLDTIKYIDFNKESLSKTYKTNSDSKVGKVGFTWDLRAVEKLLVEAKNSVEAKKGLSEGNMRIFEDLSKEISDVTKRIEDYNPNVFEKVGNKILEGLKAIYRLVTGKKPSESGDLSDEKVIKVVMGVINAINKHFLGAIQAVKEIVKKMGEAYQAMVNINKSNVEVFYKFLTTTTKED